MRSSEARYLSFKFLQVGEEYQGLYLCINQWLVEDSPGEESDVTLDEVALFRQYNF